METGDKSYISNADGKSDTEGKFVTMTALPYPLPESWSDKFKAMGKESGLYKSKVTMAEFLKVETKCRDEIGITFTRKYIPPVDR